MVEVDMKDDGGNAVMTEESKAPENFEGEIVPVSLSFRSFASFNKRDSPRRHLPKREGLIITSQTRENSVEPSLLSTSIITTLGSYH